MNDKIPKTIMQTGPWKTYDGEVRDRIISMNPGYDYEYYNNDDCVLFLEEHFGSHLVNTFNALRPGAFKADLFRYCYIYIKGGVYIDIDLEPLVPLDEIIPHEADFVSVRENIIVYPKLLGIWQAFMAGKKNLDFLRDAIVKIVNNVHNKVYPSGSHEYIQDVLSITGPSLLYNAMHISGIPKLGYSKARNNTIYLYHYGPNTVTDHNNLYGVYDASGRKIFYDHPSLSTIYIDMFRNREVYQ